MALESNSGERDYDHDELEEYEEEEEWHEQRMDAPSRIQYHSYPIMQRPTMSTVRLAPQQGVYRKLPHIIRKPATHARSSYNPTSNQQHAVRHIVHPVRLIKMDQRVDHSRSITEGESSSLEAPYLGAYANEETVRTTSGEGEEREEGREEEGETRIHDHSIKRLEDDLEVDVEGVTDGPSTSVPKMIVRKTLPVFHAAENKALIENHHLKTKMAQLIDSNCRFREEVSQLREEKRELIKQLRKQEKAIEKQQMELAVSETNAAELKRNNKEIMKKFEKEFAVKEKRRKATTVMPCLPNRKVVFSKATKQAQSLRLRLLHRYLSELCGPVEPEHRLEEKNLIVLRWRKAHAPKPSLEIGRQLLPVEEEEFCRKFGIVGEKKKEMKKWLGLKHIDLFGPSERAIAVRKWRMGQREKKRKGEKEEQMIAEDEDIMDEVGNDTDDDELMDDIEDEIEEDRVVERRVVVSAHRPSTEDEEEEGGGE